MQRGKIVVFYQKLFKYKNSYDIKVTIKGYYFVVNSDEIKLFLLLNQYQMSVGFTVIIIWNI